jgi:hypothetical protein
LTYPGSKQPKGKWLVPTSWSGAISKLTIVEIMKGFVTTTCPYTMRAGDKSPEISLIMESDRIIRCEVASRSARGLIEKSSLEV